METMIPQMYSAGMTVLPRKYMVRIGDKYRPAPPPLSDLPEQSSSDTPGVVTVYSVNASPACSSAAWAFDPYAAFREAKGARVAGAVASEDIAASLRSLESRVDGIKRELARKPMPMSFAKKVIITVGLAFLSASAVRYWMNHAEDALREYGRQQAAYAAPAPQRAAPAAYVRQPPARAPMRRRQAPRLAPPDKYADIDAILQGN